jgi:hypothetical protein
VEPVEQKCRFGPLLRIEIFAVGVEEAQCRVDMAFGVIFWQLDSRGPVERIDQTLESGGSLKQILCNSKRDELATAQRDVDMETCRAIGDEAATTAFDLS